MKSGPIHSDAHRAAFDADPNAREATFGAVPFTDGQYLKELNVTVMRNTSGTGVIVLTTAFTKGENGAGVRPDAEPIKIQLLHNDDVLTYPIEARWQIACKDTVLPIQGRAALPKINFDIVNGAYLAPINTNNYA